MLKHVLHSRPIAVIDLETTGLSPETDRIVELAVLRIETGQPVKVFQRRVNPGVAIPAAASRVHWVFDRDVAAMPRLEQLVDPLLEVLGGCDLCGFNLFGYDLPLLLAELGRCRPDAVAQLALLEEGQAAGRRAVDVMRIYHAMVPWTRTRPRSLSMAVATYLKRSHDKAHGAFDDAWAAAEVLDALVDHFHLPRSFDELHIQFAHDDSRVW